MTSEYLTGLLRAGAMLASKMTHDRVAHVQNYLNDNGIRASYSQTAQYLTDLDIPLYTDKEVTKMTLCRHCKAGYVQLDTDSFETNIETELPITYELSAKVTGYCLNCSAEHVYSIHGNEDVVVNASGETARKGLLSGR